GGAGGGLKFRRGKARQCRCQHNGCDERNSTLPQRGFRRRNTLFLDNSARVRQYGVDLHARITDRLPAKPGILLKAATKNLLKFWVQLCRKQTRVWFSLQHRSEYIRYFFAVKGLPAGEHLVQHTAEGEDVAALIRGATSRLFGRHVCGRTEDNACIRSSKRQCR